MKRSRPATCTPRLAGWVDWLTGLLEWLTPAVSLAEQQRRQGLCTMRGRIESANDCGGAVHQVVNPVAVIPHQDKHGWLPLCQHLFRKDFLQPCINSPLF